MKNVKTIIGVALLSSVLLSACNQPPTVEPVPAPVAGYINSSEGLVKAEGGEMVVKGKFAEAVVNDGYLLSADEKGKLTLTNLADKKTVSLSKPKGAYQLKAVGNHFGYLQQKDGNQYITFLDPKDGKSSSMETEHDVITWDAEGTSIAYHLYETGTIGFAEYNGKRGWDKKKEKGVGADTLGQIFSEGGKNYIWVLTDKTNYKVYAMDTRKEDKDSFPVIDQLEEMDGTLADIVGEHLIVSIPTEGAKVSSSEKNGTEIWSLAGSPIYNMTILGYEYSGNAAVGNDSLYIPASFTDSDTPDGILVLDLESNSTTFVEKGKSYVAE